jgi:hypothetical protein
MLRYEETHPGSFYWYDPFSLNQHSDSGVVGTEVLEKAFGDQISDIGATLIVSSPWNNPQFLCRMWCTHTTTQPHTHRERDTHTHRHTHTHTHTHCLQ